jgi:hypothetical protein
MWKRGDEEGFEQVGAVLLMWSKRSRSQVHGAPRVMTKIGIVAPSWKLPAWIQR